MKIPDPKFEFIDGHTLRLAEPYSWDGATVPRGFETDGASIPRAFWIYVHPFYDGLRAALLHDQDYRVQDKTRKEADALFYRRLVMLGIRRSKAWVLWLALRAGGGRAWKQRARENG